MFPRRALWQVGLCLACLLLLQAAKLARWESDWLYGWLLTATKLGISGGCLSIVLAVGSVGLSPRDTILSKLAFVLFFAGDCVFATDFTLGGVGLFGLAQLVLLVRHSAGLWPRFFVDSYPLVVSRLTGVTLLDAGLLGGVLWPLGGHNPLFPVIVIYAVVLSLSLLAGWMATPIGFFPLPQARLIAGGMTLFYLCDFSVGLAMLLPIGTTRVLVGTLAWLLYTPALLCLACSVYPNAAVEAAC